MFAKLTVEVAMLPGKTRLTKSNALVTKLLTQKLPQARAIKTRFLLASNASQQGLTLLECLVAIGVIAVVVTAFTPQIFLAVATQVQNRRAEQALQLAQGEVDRVRRTVERGDYNDTELPPVGANPVRQQAPPGSAVRLQPNQLYPSSPGQGALVDVNGDGRDDFIVQTYRTPGRVLDGRTAALGLGVRVYTFTTNQGSFENPPQKAASLTFTTAAGQQQRRPLAMIYTTVARSDNRNSLCTYRQLPTATGGGDDANNAACQ
jgi:prepilin-type N-terminal cleavage/methylation domain-containing protein